MPEIVRGSRQHDLPSHSPRPLESAPLSPLSKPESAQSQQAMSTAGEDKEKKEKQEEEEEEQPRSSVTLPRPSTDRPQLADTKGRNSSSWRRQRKESMRRAEADVYYDSRAATKREFRRRATTLMEYYHENPKLLPQLPFTWHHGWRRFRLGLLIFLMFVDACVIPIVLYYAMDGAGVEGWIIFAVVTTIWGGPTYLEFGIRTLRLIKKERFYRPLGTNSRWCFDLVTWASVLTITVVTALFVVGSAPHIVFLRVLCMPGPATLYCLGGVLFIVNLYHMRGWKAPFRISSTAKGEPVKPAVYYFIEDVVAVNAGAGRPYREALAARYEASAKFRQMLHFQSMFWSIPAIIIAIPLTVIAVIHSVPAKIAYGICWAVPFVWATIWGFVSVYLIKRDMRIEREEWEADDGIAVSDIKVDAAV